MDFENTRKRLYCLSFAISALLVPGYLVAVAVYGQTTEPVVQLPVELSRYFIPGLPTNLLDAGLKFPLHTIVLAVVVGVVFWMNRVVKLAEDEQAFQTWLRRRVIGAPPIPAPALTARIIARITPVCWLLPVLLVLALALGAVFSSGASEGVAGKGAQIDPSAKRETRCIGACGPRRLAHGESVRVTVVAQRKRNETGLLLARGESYTARFVENDGWRDGSYDAGPLGVEFEGWTRWLARTLEWLRPYPQGDWFQLIGRIDRGRDVFPVLGPNDSEKSSTFEAPKDGELVLLVNDVWYANNGGFLTVEIGADSGS